MSLSEQEFRVKSDEALNAARHALLPLADSEGFEVELQNGVLNVVFEEPVETKFVVSPNAPDFGLSTGRPEGRPLHETPEGRPLHDPHYFELENVSAAAR